MSCLDVWLFNTYTMTIAWFYNNVNMFFRYIVIVL